MHRAPTNRRIRALVGLALLAAVLPACPRAVERGDAAAGPAPEAGSTDAGSTDAGSTDAGADAGDARADIDVGVDVDAGSDAGGACVPDGAPVDVPPGACPTRNVPCDPSCSVCVASCGRCTRVGIFRTGDSTPTRYSDGLCADVDLASDGCMFHGYVSCFNGGRVCAAREIYQFPAVCMSLDSCLAFRERVQPTLGPGEDTLACTWSDGTPVVTGRPAAATCASGLAVPTCGEGCSPCPDGQFCMYQSEAYPTGLCLPGTSYDPPVSVPCNETMPRTPCAVGQGCLLPVRGSVGSGDDARWGVCLAAVDCQQVATALPDGYRCDTGLVE